MSSTYSSTQTYTVADIEIVMRRVTADIIMIASSTEAITEDQARDWGHDIEELAKKGYLRSVDLTLFNGSTEIKATCFEVNTESGDFKMSRPGGVLWPKVANPNLRIVLRHTKKYDAAAEKEMKNKLRINWSPTTADTSHSTLKSDTGRDYASNGYGMQRKDFSQ